MAKKADTVEVYVAALPDDRREIVEAVREAIAGNIDEAFEFGMQYGMLGWYLPHSEYPAGYHSDPSQPLPFIAIGNQKNHVGLYLFCIYCDQKEQERFVKEWKATGSRLDMGKSCVRVKKLEDIPLEVLGGAVKRASAARFVKAYESSVGASSGKKRAKAKGR